MNTARPKRAYKSSKDRVLTGVGAGLAEYFETDPLVIRLLFVFLTLANGIGIALYVMLVMILPTEEQVIEDQDDDFFAQVVSGIPMKTQDSQKESVAHKPHVWDDLIVRENILAFILILVGALVLQMNVVPWSLIPNQAQIPVLIVVVGFAFIVKSTNTK